jgi:uncharacterized membrane protein YvlD (DUF360 family)
MRGSLTVMTLGAVAAVLLVLSLASGATVASDGRLIEPFWAIALGTLTLTSTGIVGLTLLFRAVRRRSACGRGDC